MDEVWSEETVCHVNDKRVFGFFSCVPLFPSQAFLCVLGFVCMLLLHATCIYTQTRLYVFYMVIYDNVRRSECDKFNFS